MHKRLGDASTIGSVSVMNKQGPITSIELSKFIKVIEEFRKLSPSFNANAILAFILVASRPGITVGQVQEYLGLYSSTTVRLLAMMAEYHKKGEEGLGLIYSEEDIVDRRVKHLYLKPRGVKVWRTIADQLDIPRD